MHRIIIFLTILGGMNFIANAQILHKWGYQNNKVGKVSCTSKMVKVQVSKSVKTESGGNVLTVKLLNLPEKCKPWDVNISYNSEQKIVAGSKYIIKFSIKGTPGSVNLNSIMGKKPWSIIKGSSRKLNITEEWQSVNVEFTSNLNIDGNVKTPFIMLGKYTVGGTLYIGPVTLEEVQKNLPLALNPDWMIYLRPDLSKVNLATISSAPAMIGTVKGKKIILKGNEFDLGQIAAKVKTKDVAVLINEFNCTEDGYMQIGCAADWWFEFMVNGKKVYDTLNTGNMESDFKPENHIFNFPVKKGKNIIAVKVLSGSGGWKFFCGKVKFKEKVNRITKIEPGKEWRPVKMDNVKWTHLTPKRVKQFDIVPNTALDLSRQFEQYDIDKMGRLKISDGGNLFFEKAAKKTVRLRGFNFIPGSWQKFFYRMTHRELETLAEQIKLNGMNLIRFHFLAKALCGNGGLPKQGDAQKFLHEVPMNTTPEALPIDKAFLDRFDYFNKCCRDRGIYIMFDILTDEKCGWTTAVKRAAIREGFRYGMMTSEKYRKNWQAGFNFLMNHKNPYTQKRIIDDPQYIGITFFNEQEHLFSDGGIKTFTPEWRKFRNPEQPESVPEFSRKLLQSNTPDGIAARNYLLNQIENVNKFYLDCARKTGFKGLVTNWDMFVRNLEGYARRNMNAVALHTYFAHPHRTKLSPANYKQSSTYAPWNRGKMYTVFQGSSIKWNNNYLGRVAVSRNLKKPFLLTEYSHNGYNIYTHEAGIIQGACAALQGWDALTPHANTVGLYYGPFNSFSFDDLTNLSGKTASLLTSFMWQRGDVQEAKHSVNFQVPESVVRSGNILGAIGSGYNALFMLVKIGSDYNGQEYEKGLNVEPKVFTGARSKGMYVVLSEEIEEQRRTLETMVEKLRAEKYLSPDNKTDINKGILQSDTGEIITDVENKTMTVTSPRFEAAVLKKSQPVILDALKVNSNSIPCSISAISLDRNKSLKQTKHSLLVIATMFAAENSVWSTEKFNAELDNGDIKQVMRAGTFNIELATAQTQAPKVYALNLNGTREKELPVSFDKGKLKFNIDTSKLQYGTPYFEIIWQ